MSLLVEVLIELFISFASCCDSSLFDLSRYLFMVAGSFWVLCTCWVVQVRCASVVGVVFAISCEKFLYACFTGSNTSSSLVSSTPGSYISCDRLVVGVLRLGGVVSVWAEAVDAAGDLFVSAIIASFSARSFSNSLM